MTVVPVIRTRAHIPKRFAFHESSLLGAFGLNQIQVFI